MDKVNNSQSGIVGFAALVAIAASTLVMGFNTGQENPEAKNILHTTAPAAPSAHLSFGVDELNKTR